MNILTNTLNWISNPLMIIVNLIIFAHWVILYHDSGYGEISAISLAFSMTGLAMMCAYLLYSLIETKISRHRPLISRKKDRS